MTDRALVIGIDHYAKSDWHLRAAVRDAVAFAKWVTEPGAGRASPETLTLLLSPHPDRPVTELPFQQATTRALQDALLAQKKGVADGVQRFWFFFAGHGMAPPGGGPDQAPLMVPSDEDSVERLQAYPIELGRFIGEMQVHPPQDQIYFVDACRGLVQLEDPVVATSSLFFDLSKVPPDSQARQAVLLATTAGQLANELGLHGLFGGALIKGLKGEGPKLEPDVKSLDFVLTFGALVDYTKVAIRQKAEELRRAQKDLPTQMPMEALFRVQGSLELARFNAKPKYKVRVFVQPEAAAPTGTAGIRAYNDGTANWERQQEKVPPLEIPLLWELPSAVHRIEIEAPGFENWAKSVDVSGSAEFNATLEPRHAGLETLEVARSRPIAPDGAELRNGAVGELVVITLDKYARIEVFDAADKRVGAGWAGYRGELPVGAYRVEVAFPTERAVEQTVLLTSGEPTFLDFHPAPELTQILPESAAAVFSSREGFSEPSEVFGFATTTRLGSLLAWAASAAQFPPDYWGQKLRSLGVLPVPHDAAGCFVRVLVGDTRVPSSYSERQGPIESLTLKFGDLVAQPIPVPGLLGYAAQWSAPVLWNTSLVVSTDGLSPKRLPLPWIPGHVWTIVIARETTQRTEIHRYLDPVSPVTPFDDTIRLVEQNWRALDARLPLAEGEAERLLMRTLDPLALVVLGYRLLREDRKDELGEVLKRLDGVNLADVAVLEAGLENRDKNMTRALEYGSVPLVSEGFRALESWLIERFAVENSPPPHWPEPITAGFWTSFDPKGQPVVSKAFLVQDAPAWASPLIPAAYATARIDVPGPKGPYLGTGFLVAPRRLVLADFVASILQEDEIELLGPATAEFDGASAAIEAILGTTDPERHAALARLAPFDAAPAKLRFALPEVGTRIAVIGYPRINFTPTPVTLAAFATYPAGSKMIMPGVIIDVAPTQLTYECWTMAGVAGGPIVDLVTGEVIGLHHSGRFEGGTRKTGWGVPLTAITELLEMT